jgi:squalene-associated FAD-dependent desaturase
MAHRLKTTSSRPLERQPTVPERAPHGAIAVVGGGYAGMAAAVALARRGLRPTIYESAQQLGGRARKVMRGERVLDNGQHLLIGAYRELLGLMTEVGVPAEALLRLPLRLTVLPEFDLRTARLPAPWHLALGLLNASGLSLRARLACMRFVGWARRNRFRLAHDGTVAALLAAQRQDPNAIRYLWEPLCVAALNTPVSAASAQVFLHVLRDGLFGMRTASDLLLPRSNLGALFPEPAAAYVCAHGGEMRMATRVTRIEPGEGGFVVHDARGSTIYRQVVIATQPAQVRALVGALPALAPTLTLLDAFAYQPIVTVYLQYAASPLPARPLLGLAGGSAQWLFDRGAIAGEGGLLAAVISAHPRGDGVSHGSLALQVGSEIAALYPQLGAPQWTQVIEEKRATFACTPGLERPSQRTPVPGLFLAGDYTEAEYPATLEAAVRSGLTAAQLAAEPLQASSARR